MVSELLPLLAASPLLLWMGFSDLRFMRIPNWLVLALVAVFVVSAPFLPFASVTSRLLAAAVLFVLCVGAFAAGVFGGGDAKALPAVVLLVPPGTLDLFGLLFSGTMLAGLVFVGSMQMMPGSHRTRWVGLRARGMFPMGVSISAAGLIHPFAMMHFAL